jgi:phenylacetate-coenzyme A ligase PaaK-like adenylate-forming protein
MDSGEDLANRTRYVCKLAKEMPFYLEMSKNIGVDLNEIKTPKDLLRAAEKGLYTTPADLNELVTSYPYFKQHFLTSGIIGKPKIVSINMDDIKRDRRQCEQGYKCFIEADDVVLNCFPSSPAVSGLASLEGLSSFPVRAFHAPLQTLSDAEMFLTYHNMFRPNTIFGLTTSVYRLPVKLEEKGVDSKKLGITKIMTSAEPSSKEKRESIGKEFGGASVYDWYASSENLCIAHEKTPFSNEYRVTLPETLLFLVKEGAGISVGETGDVLLTNLHKIGEKPNMILLNYKIGDWAKCLDKKEDGTISFISDIRRWAAYLGGTKLDPTEIEQIVEELKKTGDALNGEYILVNYHDEKDRKSVGEIRVESRRGLSPEEKEKISVAIRERIYSSNIPVRTLVEEAKDAKLSIEVTDPGELYKGYEKFIRPGKPRRLLVLDNG